MVQSDLCFRNRGVVTSLFLFNDKQLLCMQNCTFWNSSLEHTVSESGCTCCDWERKLQELSLNILSLFLSSVSYLYKICSHSFPLEPCHCLMVNTITNFCIEFWPRLRLYLSCSLSHHFMVRFAALLCVQELRRWTAHLAWSSVISVLWSVALITQS